MRKIFRYKIKIKEKINLWSIIVVWIQHKIQKMFNLNQQEQII